MLTDLQLLSRYHHQGDATAFRDLVQAHAGMVFATARRITRDEAMAEDVAQETFFQLARQSRHITQSVAAWLHRVAWRRACNAVRDDATRRRIEEEAAASEAAVRGPTEHEATWAEVETELDAAIDELPDNLRVPLVMHFLQSRSQREIAEQLGVNQSTVSRQVDEGLSVLRSQLQTRGLLCGAGLAALLTANSASAAPAALIAALGKLSMSGIGATTATTASAGASTALWMKAGIAALLAAGGVWIVSSPSPPRRSDGPGVAVVPITSEAPHLPRNIAPAVAVPVLSAPQRLVAASAPAPVSSPAAAANVKPMPVHELVHSFPKPPMHPRGHLALDADGWLWGTVGSGGHYGLGAIYKMRVDGSDWQEVVAFNGITGVLRGKYPRGGLTPAPDGTFWGVTESGGAHDDGTLFNFDPRSGTLDTAVDFDRMGSPWARPWIAPGGEIWGTTYYNIYRFDPKSREVATIARFAGLKGHLRGGRAQAGLTPDGLGFLWGATSEGGSTGNGTIFKVNLATGEAMTVLDFTGKDGACIGKQPLGDFTLGADGNLWGTTRNGGSADFGTVFKIAPSTGVFTHVAEFNLRNRAGQAPETQLAADGAGCFWGTASYGGEKGHGSIYKINASTGELTSMVAFTGTGGTDPGGPARGDLLPDGVGGFFGACDFGGKSRLGIGLGLVYHLDIKTGAYTMLKDIAETASNAEGSDPRGTLVSDDAGWLWGGTLDGGAQHSGTIYKFDPVTDELVTVVHFTGEDGQCRGHFSGQPLVRDGKGFIWGTTYIGQSLGEGTVFKIDERTGEFTEVIEISKQTTPRVQAPFGGIAFDNKGFLWAAAYTSIIKIDPNALTVKTIAPVKGGWLRGGLTLDGNGVLWGCSQSFPRRSTSASLFKIDTATEKLTIVQNFDNADAGWNGWNPCTDMWWDGKESVWFSAVFDIGTGTRQCTLYELNTRSGELVSSQRNRDFRMINSPMLDDRGMLWGTGSQFGFGSPGYIYTFDTRTRQFAKLFEFTGAGSQALTGAQLDVARPYRHTDGNYYGLTRMGGPGNGGTIYRLRFGPTPMTQEAVILADGKVELHGVIRPNGLDTEVAFEWGLDPLLKDASTLAAGTARAGETAKPVQALLADLKRGTTHYFRVCGRNSANSALQRGAILRFVTPEEKPLLAEAPLSPAATTNDATSTDEALTTASTQTVKHKLRVIMVPGAGAGIVRGWRWREGYEIGKSYTLTAQADNRYVFASWSGVGISGATAENPQLSFVFTEELARHPVITATFVRNPFHESLLGPYHGLVYARDGVQASLSSTGELELKVQDLGDFTARLRYDGDELPVAGVFDTGGSARFGDALAFTAVIPRAEKPTLLLSLQLDLTEGGTGGVIGHVGLLRDEQATWLSQMQAIHDMPAALLAADSVIQRLTETGALEVDLLALDSAENLSPAKVLLQPDGRIQLSASFPDGSVILSDGHVSSHSRISFFHPFAGGSVGVELPLVNLLHRAAESSTPHGWWIAPGSAVRPITLRATASEAVEK